MGKSHKSEKSKKKHKHKERKEKKKSKKLKKHTKDKKEKPGPQATSNKSEGNNDFAIPLDLMNSKSHAPETPEEYQKRQSRMRREVDPSTGRIRLIKGDGEVLEEIVSKERHKAINTEATHRDSAFFQENTFGKFK